MTPREFIAKWHNSPLKERAAAQAHFLDLCRLLDEPTPADTDPTGKDYGFEVGASKTTGGNGFADVFKRGCFAWEYKGGNANLDAAFAQLQRYAVALDNPPLLIVSDIATTIRIHTNWTNSVSKIYEIAIADLENPEKRGWLKAALSDPDALRPTKTRQELTEEVAGDFARLARSLRDRGHAPEHVAHFINRLVFCMFAEDVKLLPDAIFTRMLERALEDPGEFKSFARDLFAAMKGGGRVGFEKVAWFNGGLFDDGLAFELTKDEIKIVHHAASRYWGDIDPSILGTLFERGLDPDKRSQLGAHYTDRDKIMMIINPVIVEPLTAEWEAAMTQIASLMEKTATSKGAAATRARNQAQAILDRFLKRLAEYRVLDPACGSGNFLYLALRALKDLEHRAQVEAEALGLPRGFPQIGPEVVKGIELNPYAAELARVSVWIGEIQWMLKNGFAASQNPILKPLNNIECRDALLTWLPDQEGGGKWTEAEWPQADAIIGNPPFLGAKLMKRKLGISETERLRSVFSDRLPGFTDLVCYWFEKARAEIVERSTIRVGLVSTKAIAKNTNLPVLRRIASNCKMFDAYKNEPWVIDGAAVRVSIICFRREKEIGPVALEGVPVNEINADLTSGRDLSSLAILLENDDVSFVGIQKSGPFDISGALARSFLRAPMNPNGRPNADILRPTVNGSDLVSSRRDIWMIDFPRGLSAAAAALFELPFEHLRSALYDQDQPELGTLHDVRQGARDRDPRTQWWTTYWPRPEVRRALSGLRRYIVTPMTAEHRVFTWQTLPLIPDNNTVIFARDDDTTFGILHSIIHEVWTERAGNRMGAGNQRRYNPEIVLRTFPFPAGLTPDISARAYADDPRSLAISLAAHQLNELRDRWLNPPDLIQREPEVVPGFPDRILPVNEAAEKILKKRTLTNLYNDRPAWLDHAHQALDEAVSAAYGWPADLPEEEILGRLFSLNQERAAKQT